MKKLFLLVLALVSLITLLTPTAYATDTSNVHNEEDVFETVVLGGIGDEITLERQADGNFVGTYEIVDPQGVLETTITVYLNGLVASDPTRYRLGFNWAGTAQVGTIAARSITVKEGDNYFSNECFSYDNFSASCGGQTAGSCTVGTFNIPAHITHVRVRTEGLTAYFLSGATWFTTGDINQGFDVNWFI